MNFFQMIENHDLFPLWMKLVFLVFVLILLPVYKNFYGWTNFLWFSDISLFITLIAVWTENALLASMMAVGLLIPEIGWNIDFFVRLFLKKKIFGLGEYMFDQDIPLYIRLLSLFHVILPVIWLYMLFCLGYKEYALILQTVFSWLVLLFTYAFTNPNDNINWVFGLGNKPQKKVSPSVYFIFIVLFYPLLIFLPTHFLLLWLFT